MRKRSSKNSKDINPVAAGISRAAAAEHDLETSGKNPAAVALGRLGGLKGGRARADSLSPKRRSLIAKRAALARWAKEPE
jgi:hypothetical protein